MSSSLNTKYEKMRNAYLLFYERIEPYDPPESDEDENSKADQSENAQIKS